MGFVGDWISDAVDAVGDFFGDVAEAVGNWVSDAAEWLWDQAEDLVSGAIDIISDVLDSEILMAAIAAIGVIVFWPEILFYSSVLFSELAATVATWAASFKTFLEAIHFKTLMSIHRVAMLVSADYREIIHGVFAEISKYSAALNLGASFIPLALENARMVVHTTSAALGRSYDLGEVAWLQILGKWAEETAKWGARYENRPWLVIEDLSLLYIKPQFELQSGIMQQLLGNVDALLNTVELTVNKTNEIIDAFEHLVADLPAQLRQYVEPKLRRITDKLSNFIDKEYQPRIDQLHDIINAVTGDVKYHGNRLDGLVDRLKLPGNYMSEIHELGSLSALEQQIRGAEAINGAYEEVSNELTSGLTPLVMELKSVLSAIKERKPGTGWAVFESVTPVIHPVVSIDGRNTWFVGDF